MVFDLVAKFASYGFNKSHAAAYALVAYQTAWLKANYPVEFLAASMTLDIGNTDKLNEFRLEAQRLGIEVVAPDINRSSAAFLAEEGRIIYSLAALKGVGAQVVEHIVAMRGDVPFANPGRFRRPDRSGDRQPAGDGMPRPGRRLRLARARPRPGLREHRARHVRGAGARWSEARAGSWTCSALRARRRSSRSPQRSRGRRPTSCSGNSPRSARILSAHPIDDYATFWRRAAERSGSRSPSGSGASGS